MNEIQRQVQRVRRRLNFGEFLRATAWSLTIALTLGLIGLAVPRIWVLPIDNARWTWSCLGGSLAMGLFTGWLLAYWKRRGDLQAAIELDKRFSLRERVSSALALPAEERESPVGQALLADTARRVERIDVREQFEIRASWKTLLPLIPALGAGALVLFVPIATKKASASSEQAVEVKERLKKAAAELERKIAEQKQKLKDKGLEDASQMLDELAKGADNLKKADPQDRKDALVKLNELMKDSQKRQKDLGGAEKLKDQLKNLEKLEEGPADKLGEAMREGDVAKAAQEMKKLIDRLQKGELNKEEREKLADQLERLGKKLEKANADHEQKMQNLKEQIEQKKNEGKLDEAAKLQDELEKMQAQQKQMGDLAKRMAEKMNDAAKDIRQGGDAKQAAQQAQNALQDVADDLQKMQQDLDELEALDEAMDEIEDAKKAMNCDQCKGAGCKDCRGNGKKEGPPGNGMGEGQGQGERPESETDTKGYDSRVRAKPEKGKATRIGDAGGANLPGQVRENVKEAISNSMHREPDPLDETALPRDQREHSREYFEKLLKGE